MQRLLVTFVLLEVLILSPRSPQSLSAQQIAISYAGFTEAFALWMAKDGGFFKDNGIEAQLIYMEGGRLSIQSLLSGHTQFMTGDAVSALTAVGGGADIMLLAAPKNILPIAFAVSKEVKHPQDLKGKVVGISQIGGRAGEIARVIIKNIGLDPDRDVSYLAVGGTMSRLAALSGGRVQAAPIASGLIPIAEEKGLQTLEVEPMPFISDALWSTQKYVQENPSLVYRVLRGYVAGIAAVLKDKQKTLVVFRRYMRTVDSKAAEAAYEAYIKELDKVPIPNDRAIQNTVEISRRLSPRLSDIDIRKHFYFGPIQRLKEEGYIDRLYK
jgi:NitT/TauT family transport system substrate-binding protein